MKKEGAFLFVILLVLLTSSLALAQDERIDKAYDCLEGKVEDRCDELSVEEQAFTILATGRCSSELEDNGDDDECWPDGNCRLRDTSLAILALDRIGKSTTDAEDWLLNQERIPTGLVWYLEIDSDEETTCEISYGSTEKTVTIREDKKINRDAGSCLSLAMDNYWLEIDEDCYRDNFTISCDKDFLTALLYKKQAGSTIYVSSETESASAGGSTEHTVNSFCFEQSNSCNYEGSLWAAFALAKTNKDISSFLPYLIAMEEDNEKFFPSAFLYMITDYDEYFTKVIEEQKDDYWKIKDSSYHQFYDTALALLSLYGTPAEQIDTAKDYLFEVQGDNGCWRDNVRDTAFILYAIEPKPVSAVGGSSDDCEDYNYYCTSPLDCSQIDLAGDNFACYGGKVCCKTEPEQKTCDEKGGIECTDDQECTGATVLASDTNNCCKGSCITGDEEPECEEEGFDCRYSCSDNEEERIYDCGSGETCCAPKPSSGGYGWVWILIILIILVVVAIIFRKRLRVLLSKIKGKFKRRGQGPVSTGARPGFPPGRPGPRPVPRRIMPRGPVPARRPGMVQRAITKTDKELEDTLKKLKEMSK